MRWILTSGFLAFVFLIIRLCGDYTDYKRTQGYSIKLEAKSIRQFYAMSPDRYWVNSDDTFCYIHHGKSFNIAPTNFLEYFKFKQLIKEIINNKKQQRANKDMHDYLSCIKEDIKVNEEQIMKTLAEQKTFLEEVSKNNE